MKSDLLHQKLLYAINLQKQIELYEIQTKFKYLQNFLILFDKPLIILQITHFSLQLLEDKVLLVLRVRPGNQLSTF